MERNIRAKTNEDFEIAARWSDESGVPYPLSSGQMHVRTSVQAANPPLLTATVTISADNWATAVIPATTLASVGNAPALLVYDFFVIRASDSRKKVLLEGDFVLLPGVTHA